MDTEVFREFFQAFSQAAGITLHVETLYGVNCHHIIESIFKALARSLRQAVAIEPREDGRIPSTKGVLGGSLRPMKLAVVDYGSGNLQSVGQALMAASRLAEIDVDLAITADPADVAVLMLSCCRGGRI